MSAEELEYDEWMIRGASSIVVHDFTITWMEVLSSHVLRFLPLFAFVQADLEFPPITLVQNPISTSLVGHSISLQKLSISDIYVFI